MGFTARKGKSVEVTLTTEISQDGMLFIAILLLKTISYYSNTLYLINLIILLIEHKSFFVL